MERYMNYRGRTMNMGKSQNGNVEWQESEV